MYIEWVTAVITCNKCGYEEKKEGKTHEEIQLKFYQLGWVVKGDKHLCDVCKTGKKRRLEKF